MFVLVYQMQKKTMQVWYCNLHSAVVHPSS